MNAPLKIFIGYDEREDIAAQVCEYSLRKYASKPLDIQRLDWNVEGYERPWHWESPRGPDSAAVRVDDRDGRPFSTAFTFARFLVPALCGYRGMALFVDCDFLFKQDVAELFALASERHAVSVVQHTYWPKELTKMDGQSQSYYPRKNWSSLVLWNCGHPFNRILSPGMVNHLTGRMLHGFKWLEDEEIGNLPPVWNYLVGYSDLNIKGGNKPKALHYTEGGPWFKRCENCDFAADWLQMRDEYQSTLVRETHHASATDTAQSGAV